MAEKKIQKGAREQIHTLVEALSCGGTHQLHVLLPMAKKKLQNCRSICANHNPRPCASTHSVDVLLIQSHRRVHLEKTPVARWIERLDSSIYLLESPSGAAKLFFGSCIQFPTNT